MNKPIAVFDAGLGSYAIVEAIKKAYPKKDIIYFADRKSFPYGTKTTDELKTIIEDSVDFLLKKGASFIVLASNAPSITVLDKIKNKDNVIGIYPPLKNVINDKKKNTLIIGAKVMIDSFELQEYIKKEVGDFELDESYFGAKRVRGKKGRGAAGKTPVFGLLKRGDKVFTTVVPNCSKEALMPIIQGHILDGSTINTDGWKAY